MKKKKTKIINERGDVITNPMKIKRTIRKVYMQTYTKS